MPRRSPFPGLKRGRHNRPYWVAAQITRDTMGYPDNCVPLPTEADDTMLARLCRQHAAKLRVWIRKRKSGDQPPAPVNQYLGRGHPALRQGYVYFLRAGDRIKIGFTTDWQARLKALQSGAAYPVTEFVVLEGGIERERKLHERFAALRCSGEWFEPGVELETFLRNIPPELRVR